MCVSHTQLTLTHTVIYTDYSKQLKQDLNTDHVAKEVNGKTMQPAARGEGQSLTHSSYCIMFVFLKW